MHGIEWPSRQRVNSQRMLACEASLSQNNSVVSWRVEQRTLTGRRITAVLRVRVLTFLEPPAICPFNRRLATSAYCSFDLEIS
jgi:hypothetical protein